jgi:hypothetical protein
MPRSTAIYQTVADAEVMCVAAWQVTAASASIVVLGSTTAYENVTRGSCREAVSRMREWVLPGGSKLDTRHTLRRQYTTVDLTAVSH